MLRRLVPFVLLLALALVPVLVLAQTDGTVLGDQWLTEQHMKSLVGQTAAVMIVLVAFKRIIPGVKGAYVPPIGVAVALLLQVVYVIWPTQRTLGGALLGVINSFVTYGLAWTAYEKMTGDMSKPQATTVLEAAKKT